MLVCELIARMYYLITVEIGDSFDVEDISTVLESSLTIDDFYKWLYDYGDVKDFETWLTDKELMEMYYESYRDKEA